MPRSIRKMRIDESATLEGLIERLRSLKNDSAREWGTMTAPEVLCHLGDANDWLRGRREVGEADPGVSRPILKWIALNTPFSWTKGARTHPRVDPKVDGTRPEDFEADRERVIAGLRAVASQRPEQLPARHPMFGPMSPEDWYRITYRHYDHHLRQFGV